MDKPDAPQPNRTSDSVPGLQPTPGIILESELSSLREEVRNSEAARIEFLKYKLIAVATLAAIAFGLGEWSTHDPDITPRYVLAVIPFVCIYVDALCYHNNLRINVIAKYLRCHGDTYENFLNRWGEVMKAKSGQGIGRFFNMEDWVLNFSTLALSMLVAVSCLLPQPFAQQLIIYLSGTIGLILSLIMKSEYERRLAGIGSDSCAEIAGKMTTGK